MRVKVVALLQLEPGQADIDFSEIQILRFGALTTFFPKSVVPPSSDLCTRPQCHLAAQ